jgi:hypothetical protein
LLVGCASMSALRQLPRVRGALETVGLMGRTPDYVNVTSAGFAGRADPLRQTLNLPRRM